MICRDILTYVFAKIAYFTIEKIRKYQIRVFINFSWAGPQRHGLEWLAQPNWTTSGFSMGVLMHSAPPPLELQVPDSPKFNKKFEVRDFIISF